jgi:fermentation-respiration switch protein FrsA (DUF1100 family)
VNRKKKILLALGLLLLAGLALIWTIGTSLIAAHRVQVGPAPTEWHAQTIQLASSSGATLSGWWIPGEPHQGAVILLHGVRSTRAGVSNRVPFLHAQGCSVLLFDLQAHGESRGEHITYGKLESLDAAAAVAFVRTNAPGERIAVIGTSLGGAAALLAEPPLNVDALVLESVFPTLQQATEDRLAIRFGWTGKFLAPLLTWQLRPRLGIGVDELKPIEHARSNTIPKLFIAGTTDQHTTLAESKALFAAAAEPKELWLVEGAHHTDMYGFGPAEYEQRVGAFLNKIIRRDPATKP